MTPACTRCVHGKIDYLQGRERVGCYRPRLLPNGKLMRPPLGGFEVVIERLPQLSIDWRAAGDQCGPQAKHFKEATMRKDTNAPAQ